LLSSYMANGMIAPSGQLKNGENNLYVHFPPNFESEKDLANQIVFADPKGGVVRLKDIASIQRRDQDPESYIRQNGKKTILLSLEMQQGNNIVQFGKDVQKALNTFKDQCPKDIQVNTISNLPDYVNSAVTDFMKEFMIAILAVILVVMLLLPKRVASIAGLTVPIAVLITMGFLYLFGIELNTVSLAGLIIVLGMIVDNSIVVIDNYVDKKDHGMSSWHAAIKSARELVTPILTATMAICVVYIPLGIMLPGTAGDFVRDLPATICIALVVSVIVALFVVPFLNFFFIKKGLKSLDGTPQKKSILDFVQNGFDYALTKAFNHPKITIGSGIGIVIIACIMFANMDQQLFPKVDRNQFAVEVYLDQGSSLESTSKVIDSLETTLMKDKRVTNVTSFVGTSSPRFHTMYAPNMPSPNFGQLLINTTDNEATKDLCEEYNQKFRNAFPNAHIKWKTLAMQINKYPIEIRIAGDSIQDLRNVEAQINSIIRPLKGIEWMRSDWEQKQQNIQVHLDKDKASRMGYSKGLVATSLMVGLDGIPLTTIWENDYPVEVRLTQDNGRTKNVNYLGDQYITSPMTFSSAPLRSFAKFTPQWTEGNIAHRNGTRTLTVQVDLESNILADNVLAKIRPQIDALKLPKGVTVEYGGDAEGMVEVMLPMALALLLSIAVIFFILLFQFKKVKLASLIMSTMLLGMPGAAIGLTLMGYPFGLTAFIGITSLCGIVVRNGIILIDYLQELRTVHGMGVKEAALSAGKRRMRPIFLTSAAASVGVIPMIISRSSLWGPLGTVVCFGLLISMVLTLFILPVLYAMVYKNETKRKTVKKHIPYNNTHQALPMILLLIALTFPVVGRAQHPALSLDSCKMLAVRNNFKIKEAVSEVTQSDEQKKSAFTNYFPKVSASATAVKMNDYLFKADIPQMNLPVYDGNLANLATATQYAYFPGMSLKLLDYTNMASVTVAQPLFTGGRIVNGNKLASLGKEISREKQRLTTTEVLVKTEELYWSTLSLNEKLKTLDSYQQLLNSLQNDVRISVQAGLTQRTDLLKVQLKLNELQTNRLKLTNGIMLSKMALCQHIGIANDSSLLLEDRILPAESPIEIIADAKQAVESRSEYRMLNKAVKAEELQKKIVAGELLPQVSAGAMVYYMDAMDSNNKNAIGFATVSIPISDWWSGVHKLKQSKAKVDNARNKLTETSELLAIQIKQAQNTLTEQYFQISMAQLSVEQASENLKETTDHYKAGICSMSDLLEAQSTLQSARDNHTEALCNYHISKAKYLQAINNYR
jgi:multidrug efflux pump subunit AcrB/outer membrane protein TolC